MSCASFVLLIEYYDYPYQKRMLRNLSFFYIGPKREGSIFLSENKQKDEEESIATLLFQSTSVKELLDWLVNLCVLADCSEFHV